jgi:hypothetical protein
MLTEMCHMHGTSDGSNLGSLFSLTPRVFKTSTVVRIRYGSHTWYVLVMYALQYCTRPDALPVTFRSPIHVSTQRMDLVTLVDSFMYTSNQRESDHFLLYSPEFLLPSVVAPHAHVGFGHCNDETSFTLLARVSQPTHESTQILKQATVTVL